MLRISTQSTPYVKVPIGAMKSGVAYDPTNDVVQMTFSASEHLTADATWYAASWESGGGKHWARCLVGPEGGEVELTAGIWFVFVKVTDDPEVPAVESGPIEVY